jgi:methoxymalonate biosynthesis acyl carrier protein
MIADKESIKAFVAQVTRGHRVSDDDDIFASGFVNSLFAMQLVMFVEKKFAVSVEDDDLEIQNFRSINAIVDLIERKRAFSSDACAA